MSHRGTARTHLLLLALPIFGPGVSARTWVVSQGHPQAADHGDGTETSPFKTIAPAAERAQPGDTVLVHAGIYRERVKPARGGEKNAPIVYAAALGKTVTIKGSDVYRGSWRAIDGVDSVFAASLKELTFGLYNPFKTPHCAFKNRSRGQVFVDGRRFRELESIEAVKRSHGTWAVDSAKDEVVVHFPPRKRPHQCFVELTCRTRIFAPVKRGLNHITVRGFTMEHCGNNYQRAFYARGRKTVQAGALGCRGGNHWIIENNTIRWAKALGIDCGNEGRYDLEGKNQTPGENPGYHIIRNNAITDNGCGGIAGLRSLRTEILGNRIERNNYLGIGMPETAGVKMHFFIGGRIEGNLFRDNETYGVWLDNVYAHARVTRNVFIGNKTAGIFLEMGGGPALVDNNVVAFTRGIHNGAGIYAHDAGGFTIAHNLIIGNTLWGVYIRQVTGRSYSVYPEVIDSWATPPSGKKKCRPENIRVLNNIIAINGRGAINMPYPGPNAQGNTSDYNLFSSGGMMSWLHMMPFVANVNGGVDYDGIVAAFHKAYEEKGVAREDRPPILKYHRGPLLGLDGWRTLTGFDVHSDQPDARYGFVATELTASVEMKETPPQLGAQPIPGIERDFYGRPLPAAPIPGPFQNLVRGKNRLNLWPVP